jgi:hypothetical protein
VEVAFAHHQVQFETRAALLMGEVDRLRGELVQHKEQQILQDERIMGRIAQVGSIATAAATAAAAASSPPTSMVIPFQGLQHDDVRGVEYKQVAESIECLESQMEFLRDSGMGPHTSSMLNLTYYNMRTKQKLRGFG